MNDRQAIDYTLDLMARVLPRVEHRGSATGTPGAFDTPLPYGWVQVTHIPFSDGDFADAWTGPVVDENEHFIRLEVWHFNMTFPKRECVIKRSAE